MKRSQAFPSKYLSKDDVDPPVVATIRSVKIETLKGEDGDESKPAMYFQEENVKPLLMNNANWFTCEELFGEDSDQWIGRQIEVYKDPSVMFGKKRVGGVRVRAPQQAQPANGGNKQAEPAPKPSPEMWEKYKALWHRASELNLTENLDAAPADCSAQELAFRGKALRALIEAAEF